MSQFKKRLENQRLSFRCPACPDEHLPVFAEHFEEHCSSKHGLTPQQCPWCFGHGRFPDRTGLEKHAPSCSERFISDLPPQLSPTTDEPELCDLEPLCNAVTAYPSYPISQLDLVPDGLLFQSETLNMAVGCMRLFLTSDADWMHVMIRDSVYEVFCAAVRETPVQMLPFFCHCRGGGSVHQHFILVCRPKGYFMKHVYRKLKCASKNTNIKRQMIQSPMELVEALDCVSREKCFCDFTFHGKKREPMGGRPQARNHYNVAAPLPKSHKLVLAFQWPGGILEYVHDQFRSLEAATLAPVAFQANGLWVVKIRDLPGFGNMRVLPVATHFQPSLSETDYYVHLPAGEKFFFEDVRGIADKEQWIRNQVKRGNFLYNIIGDYLYFPTLSQQKGIALLKPIIQVVEKIEQVCEETQLELVKTNESNKKLKASNRNLKRKRALMEKNFQELQRKHICYLEQENDLLRMENEDFKRRKIDATVNEKTVSFSAYSI